MGENNINLLKETVAEKYIDENVKVADYTYTELTRLLRGVNDKTKRNKLKLEIMDIYKISSEDDFKILDIYINCLNKLPNFKKVAQISEMELTTNYIDPILSQLFHIPEINKHLLWLNRKEENMDSSRPDGAMKCYNQKSNGVTLGYCEVKPTDSLNSIDLLCQDLVRLALFSRNIMLRKTNRISCCLQIVGNLFSKLYEEYTLKEMLIL